MQRGAQAEQLPDLFSCIAYLYKRTSWWKNFCKRKVQAEGKQPPKRSLDDQLQTAIGTRASSPESLYWKSLLVAYVLRNYTTHIMEIQAPLVQTYSEQALSNVLHAMVMAKRYL